MNPSKLTLKNFKGIKAGLGRDEITIDLTAIEGQLIAITGETGRGKSSILDNLHPFRLMPSRATSYSPGSFSYYDHTFDNACKELEFEHAGLQYRSILNIKGGGKAKKTEAYLQVRRGDAWAPLNDGKTATYDAALAEVMGSPELYFTSAFACQGRPLLANYSNGDIKSMLAELLNLEHIKALGKQAKEKRDLAKTHLGELQAQALKADQDAQEIALAEQKLIKAETTALTAQRDVEAQEAVVQECRDAVVRNEEHVKSQEAIITRRHEIEDEMSRHHGAADIINADHAEVVKRSSPRDAINQAQSIERAQNAMITEHLKLFDKAESVCAQKDEIDAAASELETLEAAEKDIQESLAKARDSAEWIQFLKDKINESAGAINGAKKDVAKLTEDIAAAERREALITRVPCTTNTEFVSTCPLLEDARKGAADKTPMGIALGHAEELLAKFTSEMNTSTETLKAAPEPRVAEIEAGLVDNSERQRFFTSMAALKPQLDDAQETLRTTPAKIAAAEKVIADATAQLGKVVAELKERVEQSERKRDELLDEHRKAYTVAKEKLQALPDVETINIDALVAQVEAATEQLRAYKTFQEETSQDIATIKADIALRKKNAPEAVDCAMEAAEDDVAQWTLLTKALGNDGIIALSIDDIGATISSITNDLLLECFGARYSVKIITQEPTNAGTMKEVFDIIVFDSAVGEGKSVTRMSGGETTIINEALTRSIGLFHSENSGQNYSCLFSDEADGSLSQDRKIDFIAMKRKILALGGYQRELFISHTPALWPLADAVLSMDDLVSADTTNPAMEEAA